jgi:glycerol uptake facilitator protein
VGLVWGFAVGMAVWASASISGAHFNPGVTLAMALRRKFPWVQVIPYIIFQILGGLLAAIVLTVFYNGIITSKLTAIGCRKAPRVVNSSR